LGYARITRRGIRYSNIDALHDSNARDAPVGVNDRPSLNQWSCGMLPVAIATKLASRASEARVS
jgi:hypothetical protein